MQKQEEGRLIELHKIHTCVHGHQECRNVAKKTVDDFKEMDRRLYPVPIVSRTKEEAKNDVCNPERSRFKARKQFVRHFDPGTGADRSVAHVRVPFPVRQSGGTFPRPKTLRSARNIPQTWEPGVTEFKYAKKVDVDAMIVALKSIMPETLFREAGLCRRRSFNFCADLRTAALNCLDDKVPVSIIVQSPPMSTTNIVQTLRAGDEGEQRENEDMKNENTPKEIFAIVQQLTKR